MFTNTPTMVTSSEQSSTHFLNSGSYCLLICNIPRFLLRLYLLGRGVTIMLYHNIHELDKETNTRKIEIFYSFVGRVDTGDKPTENISYFRHIGADVKSYAI